MGSVVCPETSVRNYHNMLRKIPESAELIYNVRCLDKPQSVMAKIFHSEWQTVSMSKIGYTETQAVKDTLSILF
jgi:hypothetical protein